MPAIQQKTGVTCVALIVSIFGALSDTFQKYLSTKILLDDKHFGGTLADEPDKLHVLHALAIFCAVSSMLETLALETSNVNLLIHKAFLLKKNNFYKLFACQSLRSFFISIVTCQSLISIFILAVNAFGCFYSALCIINSLSDDHIALNILAAFLILINTPLVFATDGGFFERFARSVIDGLAACLNRLKTRGTDFKYKGLGVYRSEVSSEQVGLLAPNDDLFDNQELPMTSYVPREPVGKRVWKHLTSMEGCFDDLLRQPENLSSKAKAAWFVMQVIIGSVNALIEAGFAWLVFDKFFQADNFLLFCIMGSVFLQNLALDGAVSASTLVTVIDAESRSKPKSWATFWMTILLLITCTTQAAALGYVGTEQLLEKLGWSTSWLATLVCVLGGLLKAIPNVGVELKAFRDKFDKMFPFDQTRESILDWGPINGGEGDGALALAHQPTL